MPGADIRARFILQERNDIMRQIIYGFFTQPDDAGDFEAPDVEDALYFSGMTYTGSASDEQNSENLQQLTIRLAKAGCPAQTSIAADPYALLIPAMPGNKRDAVVQNLLSDSLKNLQALVKSLTPTAFTRIETKGQINDCLNSDGHYIWLDTGTGGMLYSFNDGVRRLNAGQEYYIARQTVVVNK